MKIAASGLCTDEEFLRRIHLDLTGRRLLRRLKTWTWDLPDPSEQPPVPAADAPTGPIDPPPDEG